MLPVFQAILANPETLAAALTREPALARATMAEDAFLAEIPHWLYTGDTPLHLAAAALRPSAARLLLDAGAAPRAANRRAAEPLHYACDARPAAGVWDPEAQARTIAILIAAGADPNAREAGGATALHRAVRARSPAAVAALLRAGADPRARHGKAGSTPLHLAVQSTGAGGTAGALDQQLEIVHALLAAGASLEDRDARGRTVLNAVRSPRLAAALR